MVDIRHRVGIAATPQALFAAFTTTQGLSDWWTRGVEGDPNTGGTLRFFFGGPEPGATMEVVESDPFRRVGWRCTAGPDDWVGTSLAFDLTPADDETVVMLTHAGWRDATEFMGHCSTKWAVFLLGLKDGFEGGKATPFPDDGTISSWG
jgi:uncharacterized protein YndB with AHSA1/START domain